jgi:hypothetical protein
LEGKQIPTYFERSTRAPMRVAGLLIGILVALGAVGIVRSIPPTFASTADARVPIESDAGGGGSRQVQDKDPQISIPVARGTIKRRACPECGVIASMRQVERSVDYEMTVRFRDGSTTVVTGSGPATWRLDSRVIVIGGSNASK